MAARALLLVSAVLAGCGAQVVLEPSDGGGGGAGVTSGPVGPAGSTVVTTAMSSSATGVFETYCARMEAAEVEHEDCYDEFDPQACLASAACAADIIRPDVAPLLLDCLADNGCYGLSNECVMFDLADIPLTPAGQAFFDACTKGGTCDSLFCYHAYWMTDGALASSAECLGSSYCGAIWSCFEDTALGQCNGWLRMANPWWF